jgi:2-keto-3-deoxy-L-rhamnonate aldolase
VTDFYDQVAEKSPLPIIIYNFPAVCNGVDIDSDVMTDLAKRHKNIGMSLSYSHSFTTFAHTY